LLGLGRKIPVDRVKVDGKYGGLKLASIHVVNGGLAVEIEGLGSVNASLHVVNGGLSAKLAFGNYSGEATVEAKVSNGGLDVGIDDPGAKVKAEMEVLNGGGKFSIDGYSESFLMKDTMRQLRSLKWSLKYAMED